ncbi:MAG TPA: YicC/YloC family endoribonuclease [Polyangia bacterium]|jgi:uncharacterized protein (TIGR00255 family)|nr:YicC/YloC family endoribonuclease [Polyangia bacterium]
MTGFGGGTAEVGGRRFHVEIRSVNHRGLDLKIRTREPDATCDAEIARAVRAAVERGAVTVHLRDDNTPTNEGIDAARAKTTYRELQRLRDDLNITAAINLETIVAFMGATRSSSLGGETLWEALRPAVTAALKELRLTRQREGHSLAEDIHGRIKTLETIAARLQSESAALPERFAQRLTERLANVRGQAGIDEGRLAQEIALLAERLDVTEELVRLRTHLSHLSDICRADGAVGRKLDFIIQEVGRELNTVGSKAQDAGVAALVIDGKVELEKLREQAQNIE